MTFVLDNSVSMRWCFGDGTPGDREYARKVLDALEETTAVVPVTWGLEVANVIARMERKGLWPRTRSAQFLELLSGSDIEVDVATFDHAFSDTLELARTYKLSAYDASYLELAIRLRVPLATLDVSLLKAAKKASVKRFA